jgi:hypothetical protein
MVTITKAAATNLKETPLVKKSLEIFREAFLNFKKMFA